MRTVRVLAYDETRVAQVHTKVVMQRIAAPMVGGVVTSFVLELFDLPCPLHAMEALAPVRPTAQAAVRGAIEPA